MEAFVYDLLGVSTFSLIASCLNCVVGVCVCFVGCFVVWCYVSCAGLVFGFILGFYCFTLLLVCLVIGMLVCGVVCGGLLVLAFVCRLLLFLLV